MKRKRQESDEEQSSDDSLFKMTREMKAPKTQGYASPLTVINEDEPLDYSTVTEEDTKQVSDKRQTRATRAGTQTKRQQPKRGSQKKMPVANEEQTDSSSMDEKPRRITRNARKKIEENETLSSNEENKIPKRSTRNTRKKLKDSAEISSTEEQLPQPIMEESTSSATKNLKESGEVVPEVIVKQEPVSPVEETQPLRRSTRNSNSGQEGAKELTVPVPETPDLPADAEKSPPASAKTCKATVHLVLQSPGFNFGNGANPVVTSSPCVEQAHHAGDVTGDDIVQSEKKDTTNSNNVVTESSLLPTTPLGSLDSCKKEILKSENKSDPGYTGKKNHIESVIDHGQNSAATEKIVAETRQTDDVNKTYETGMKSGRRSTQRNSGWRWKSRCSSLCMSPGDRQQAVKKSKAKAPGKRSLVKSSVKLKLTQSKLMPELNLNGSVQSNAEEPLEPDLEGVRVRLFDNLASESSTSSGCSAGSPSSCSSAEDKADAAMEKLVEEPDDGDVAEVFHDCRATEIHDDDEAKSEQNAKTDSDELPAEENFTSPVASHDTSGSEGSEAASGGMSEEFKTPPQEKQEAVNNPPQKAKPNNIALVHSFIRRNTPKKVDPEEKHKQLRIALKEKEVKEKERREQIEKQKQREIEERKRRREERAKKAAEQRAAKLQALEEKKRLAEDQRHLNEEKAKKLKEKEDEEKKKQRLQKRAELEARRKQEEAARQLRKREQEEEEKRQREAIQRKQELEEQERQRKIAEAKRLQEHREKELERERELEKQRKLRAIEEKEKRLREKEEKERKSREEKLRSEREREEKERARIAQLIREKEEAVRREREQRAKEEKERQEREKRLREERDAALREKKRLEERERERLRILEERKLAENQSSCDSYDMTPPPVKVKRQPSSQENYNIEDLNSDDSTDEEDNPRKKIPAWARPPALTAAIFKQEYSNIDVNSIFDSVPAPNLEEIFTKKKQRYLHRTSSAIWNSPPLRPVKKGTLV